jgi:hypothetical protein
VALVRETGLYRCLGECLTVSHELSCKAHTPLNKVGMRCYSCFTGKPRKSWKRLTPDSAANSSRDTDVLGASK